MSRHSWEFSCNIKVILEAAKKKQAYHIDRKKFWENQPDNEDSSRSQGDKVKEHERHANDYASWVKILTYEIFCNPGRSMLITRDDIDYFGLW